MSKTYFAVVSANGSEVYINNFDNSLGWKKAIGCPQEDQSFYYEEEYPLKMSLASKEKAFYVKTQFEEVSLEINDQNEVEIKQDSQDSGLKEFS